MSDDPAFEIYKLLFENWRFQVQSNWGRSNYFAVFETAALGGAWFVLCSNKVCGVCVSWLGAALTLVWTLSNHKSGHYIEYWWRALRRIERDLPGGGVNWVSRYDDNCTDFRITKLWGRLRYSTLMQAVPTIFMFAWLGLIFKGCYGSIHSYFCRWVAVALLIGPWLVLQIYLLFKTRERKGTAS
ncbi:MAG: hypothetical protein WCD04_02770 [Terriglobia bacterium]|jgi:hypothetical protein